MTVKMMSDEKVMWLVKVWLQCTCLHWYLPVTSNAKHSQHPIFPDACQAHSKASYEAHRKVTSQLSSA